MSSAGGKLRQASALRRLGILRSLGLFGVSWGLLGACQGCFGDREGIFFLQVCLLDGCIYHFPKRYGLTIKTARVVYYASVVKMLPHLCSILTRVPTVWQMYVCIFQNVSQKCDRLVCECMLSFTNSVTNACVYLLHTRSTVRALCWNKYISSFLTIITSPRFLEYGVASKVSRQKN